MGLEATIIFPHQLFEEHPATKKDRIIFLVEDQLFFYDYHYKIPFHKKKLILHRASMKAYYDFLKAKGFNVFYLDYEMEQDMNYLFNAFSHYDIRNLFLCDPVDFTLEKRLKDNCNNLGLDLNILDSPSFINTRKNLEDYFNQKKVYRLTSFYINERKRLEILVTEGKPAGKRWTFDKYNRRRLPTNTKIPPIIPSPESSYLQEAELYVENRFSHHPGSTQNFIYPIHHHGAELWLDNFLETRLKNFGDYQDYIHQEEPYLFHSLLSSSLNIGILTPQKVLEKVLSQPDIPLNSKEGFIRQIIGWREFLRAVYIREGERQRTTNYLNNNQLIPDKVWEGKTGLVPFDDIVRRVYENAYAHHIERLMVVGNLMLLLDIHPDQVYHWFMMHFIDAYDWVMVPNVYGMSQYADGGLITTKPYVSSSNYLHNMSNYPSGDWDGIWDGLYWRFLSQHRHLVLKNPRMALLKKYLADEEKIRKHLEVANGFLAKIFD